MNQSNLRKYTYPTQLRALVTFFIPPLNDKTFQRYSLMVQYGTNTKQK